jgi:hypothetical protein
LGLRFDRKKGRVSYVMVPSQWKYVTAESRINKLSTAVEIEQSHFKDLKSCWKYNEAGPKPKNHPGVVVKILCRQSCCSSCEEKP